MSTWTEIALLDAPASGVFDFPSLTLTGYSKLQLVMAGLTTGTDATDIWLTFYVGGVEQTGASDYRWGQQHLRVNSVAGSDGDTSDPLLRLNSDNAGWDVGNASGEGFDGLVEIDDPNSTILHKRVHSELVFTNAADEVVATAQVGVLQLTGAITGLKITGSNPLTAGHVRVLGLA